jgi:hypothetical protein
MADETPVANPSELDFFEDNRHVHEGPLWFFSFGAYGDTHVYVWADGIESAFEIAVEWLDIHAPGLLTDLTEGDYRAAADDLGIPWDPEWLTGGGDERQWEKVRDAAEADLTPIGHTTLAHGQFIPSWEWKVSEVPRDSDDWQYAVEKSKLENQREEMPVYEPNKKLPLRRNAGGYDYMVRKRDGRYYVYEFNAYQNSVGALLQAAHGYASEAEAMKAADRHAHSVDSGDAVVVRENADGSTTQIGNVGHKYGPSRDRSTYRTFLRSAKDFGEFSSARKRTVDRGLTEDEARRACKAYNESRTPAQIQRGTKMEYDSE